MSLSIVDVIAQLLNNRYRPLKLMGLLSCRNNEMSPSQVEGFAQLYVEITERRPLELMALHSCGDNGMSPTEVDGIAQL